MLVLKSHAGRGFRYPAPPVFENRHENNARTPRGRLPGTPDFDSGSRPARENVGPGPSVVLEFWPRFSEEFFLAAHRRWR